VEELARYGAIALGAMLGANLRFVVSNWAADRLGGDCPYGRLLINVTSAFVIGLFLAFIRLFFATGFQGGYTTCECDNSVVPCRAA